MERAWLEARLAEGRSIESIAKEVGKHPSTVGVLGEEARPALGARAEARRARRRRSRDAASSSWSAGSRSARSARRSGWASRASATGWRKYGLRTDPLHYTRRDGEKPPSVLRECPRHGWTDYVRSGRRGFYRCPKCAMERVAARRRRIKEILVAEAGGRCRVCGYDIYIGALHFHHQDPSAKRFAVSRGRHDRIARFDARGGPEMRATVRKLPRGGGSRAGASGVSGRYIRGSSFRGSSTAEHSAVNRKVVGSNPTPGAP